MTREEAIKWFEGEKEAAERQVVAFESCFKCFKSAHRKIVAYNDMAISALREQEERSKGCKFCNGAKYIYGELYASGRVDDDHDFVHEQYGDLPICPMCGRRLEEV